MRAPLGTAVRALGLAAIGVAATTLALGAAPASAAHHAKATSPCHAGDVHLKLGPVDSGAGQRYASLRITANKGVSCELHGFGSGFQFQDGKGAAMPTSAKQDTSGGTGPTVTVGGNTVANIALHWSGVPADGESAGQPAPAKLALKLPGDSATTVVSWTGGQTFQHGFLQYKPVRSGQGN